MSVLHCWPSQRTHPSVSAFAQLIRLIAFFSLDTTAFGFGSGTLFGVDGFARRALALSAITAALGISLDAVLLFLYLGANARKFQVGRSTFHLKAIA